MLLNYHQKSIEVLGATPKISQSQVALINSFEENHKVRIPVSLREWYSIENSDELYEKILQPHTGIRLTNSPDVQNDCGYLINGSDPFILVIENQAVWFMAVKFNEGEDPPVYMRYNEPNKTWKLYANSFSDWINALSWDYILLSKLSLSNLNKYVISGTPDMYEKLLEFQVEAPETYGGNMHFKGNRLARMRKGDERLLVIYGDGNN